MNRQDAKNAKNEDQRRCRAEFDIKKFLVHFSGLQLLASDFNRWRDGSLSARSDDGNITKRC